MLELARPERFTYADYLQWTGDERWELIDGEALSMSPAPSRLHQEVVGGLFAQIATFLRGRPCRVYVAPFDVRLPHLDEADREVDTVVQPDISVICDESKLDDAGCRGAPDWIIEVLSPGTMARDQVRKRELYARHAVREYWIVDPMSRQVSISVLDDSGHRYRPPVTAKAGGRTASWGLPELEIDWHLVFDL